MTKSELKRLCTQDPIEMAKRIAELEYKLQEETDYSAQLQNMLAEYKHRAEAAEAKLRELERQEPVAWCAVKPENGGTYRYVFSEGKPNPVGISHSFPLYAKPFPSKQEEK